jgi:hypothetical protein
MNTIASRLATTLALAVLLCAGRADTDAPAFDHSHDRFNVVLNEFLKDGLVDYAALRADPATLDSYLGQLSAVTRRAFGGWNQKQQIAFLLNAYNACTLKLIIDHYPVKSIKEIGWLFKGPWDQEVVHLFGDTLTLDAVEHEMLRQDYTEPRVHFALVCAALGCPPLRPEAYTADKLDAQLDDQGRKFMAMASKNRVDVRHHVVYLSPIFRWFRGDFEKESGSVLNFITPYLPENVRAELKQRRFRIKYTDYDWSLNDLKRSAH